MKSRFNALDLRAITEELQPLVSGCRVINIYDHTNHSVVFKLSNTSVQKHYLIVEPGVRIHLAQDALLRLDQQKKQPTGMVMKLRKCLKGRRLMRVEQCGWDRTIRLEFGYYPNFNQEQEEVMVEELQEVDEEEKDEEMQTLKALNFFVEFFSQGNLILCEPEERNKVIAISRPITDIPGLAELIIGSHYTPNTAPSPPIPKLEQIQGIFRINKPKELKNALRSLLPFLPLHMFDSYKNVSAEYFYVQVKQFYELAYTKPLPIKAAIYCDINDGYQEFLPIPIPTNNKDEKVIECTSFNEAVDKYFCKLEEDSTKSKQRKLEEAAQAKLQAIQNEQQARIDALRASIDLTLEKAQVIESEVAMVESVCAVIRVAVENGMDWRELEDLIREEKRNGRPTALLMKKLKLDKHLVQVTLPHPHRCKEFLDVDVNFTLSLHANANWYYEQRKQAIAKLERTIKANEAALKSAKAKIDADIFSKRSATSRALIRSSKRTLWFEKYAWFLSSDGFLVLAGHDAQQNDVLVKRHLLKDDLYVHAQVNGAASVVIKNHHPSSDVIIGPRTLNEAGAFSVLHSRAWEGKVVIGSWWVRAEQVSKTAPSGEYLGTGAFMVRGRKNFIPPSPLQAGFAFLFLSSKPKSEEVQVENCFNDLSEKYERALDLVGEESDDVVELVESGNSIQKRIIEEKDKEREKREKPEGTVVPTKANNKSTSSIEVRGKKGKMKKINKKYKDQDEEERTIRMTLLGNPPKEEQDKPKSIIDTKKLEEPLKKNSMKAIIEKTAEAEEVGTEEFSILKYLISNPTDETSSDLIQAVPVCGPWSALRNYKYRVKLIPQVGSGPGKGKLCKNIVTLLSSNNKNDNSNEIGSSINDSNSKNEVELIKAVTDVDLQHALSLNKCAMQLGATDSQTLRKWNKQKKKQQAKVE